MINHWATEARRHSLMTDIRRLKQNAMRTVVTIESANVTTLAAAGTTVPDNGLVLDMMPMIFFQLQRKIERGERGTGCCQKMCWSVEQWYEDRKKKRLILPLRVQGVYKSPGRTEFGYGSGSRRSGMDRNSVLYQEPVMMQVSDSIHPLGF
jgi:hypothetical protein